MSANFSRVEKLVFLGVLALGFLFSPPTLAASDDNKPAITQQLPLDCTKSGQRRTGYDKIEIDGKSFLQAKCEEDCDKTAEPLKEAEKEMRKACSDAGKSANCVIDITKCKSAKIRESSTDPNSIEALMPMLGTAAGAFTGTTVDTSAITSALGGGANQKQPAGTCSDMSRRDYFDQKERLERELKQNTTDNTDLDREIADAKESLDKKMADAQAEINKAQKELNEKQSSINKEKREKAASIIEQQSKTAQEIRSLNSRMMDLRSQAAQTDSAYASQLAKLSSETTHKYVCLADIRKKRAEYMQGLSSNLGGSLTQAADLQRAFDECMADFKRQVLSAMDNRESTMRKFAQDISNMQASIDDQNNALNSYNQQMQEANKELDKQANDETQAVIKQMSAAQTDLKNAQDTMIQKQAALKAKQTKINARTTSLGIDLYNMGPVPPSGAQTGWRTADAAVSRYISELDSFQNNKMCCPDGESSGTEANTSSASKSYCDSKKVEEVRKYKSGVEKRDANDRRNNKDGSR